MSAALVVDLAAVTIQIGLVLVGAPLLVGVMRQITARLEGRAGAGVGQPWRDLRKQMGKERITPEGSSIVFTAAPLIVFSTVFVIAAVSPFLTTRSHLDGVADLFAVVGLLLLGTVALALGALDTGTAFGGMGASREVMVAALAEPTILVAGFALSTRVNSSNLAAMVEGVVHSPAHALTPANLFAAVAIGIVVLAETGRLPVDNPSSHLELTMLHEAMVLEYAGPRLAMVEYAAAIRLTTLIGLWVSLFLPWGVATMSTPGAVLVAVAAFVLKVALLGGAIAVVEVFLAKWRLFRVPELLAVSFLFGALAVSTAFFLAG
ncbi:respiratory chain complex I subunit 1 family protein [Rhodococcus opacus]|uniref:respiratory chain complex I subunit 1 family protein n=1 Tax=Rhodococcus opacus TaxID=37919 RepID=UPI0002A32FBC|nr:NADH-quinone oxidoreductase subunit H [Rhodococcus opacus]ELB86590.1 respiratory-chain NADH dehydrogenase subunit 1 [Rhodococcus wratislaviensis IFP 2016]MDV6247785.1 NADH-quinone oxidoreductase subunit H [Rhodococcus opacus]WKN59865.1 NADH-quinone oxidoreductase subunit H [Rhodococcus opacus]